MLIPVIYIQPSSFLISSPYNQMSSPSAIPCILKPWLLKVEYFYSLLLYNATETTYKSYLYLIIYEIDFKTRGEGKPHAWRCCYHFAFVFSCSRDHDASI